jgi:hypothetical protein
MIPVRLVQIARWSLLWRAVLPAVALLLGVYMVVLHPW